MVNVVYGKQGPVAISSSQKQMLVIELQVVNQGSRTFVLNRGAAQSAKIKDTSSNKQISGL